MYGNQGTQPSDGTAPVSRRFALRRLASTSGLVVAGVFGTAGSASLAPLTQQSTSHRDLIAQVYDRVYTKGQLEAIDQFYAPDYVDHSIELLAIESVPGNTGGEVANLTQFKQALARFLAAFHDVRMRIEDVIDGVDEVAVRATFSGTQVGQLFGLPATHRSIAWEAFDVFHTRIGEGVVPPLNIVGHW